ncbi:MAG: chromate transporter [Clostridia bacterium]|nr:chromate transporter [Clostridia bacterium]
MIFLELFWTFFTIGAFTFGGGYAMLPLIRESVAEKGWMAEQALVDFIAVSESTPGPFAVNIATYVGSQVGGIFGAVCATLGVVLPSFCIILLLARCFAKFQRSRAVQGAMSGLKPAVVGLIGAAALSIGETVFFPAGISASVFANAAIYVSLGIFLVSAVLALKKVHPILVICLSAVLGIVSGFIMG